MHHARKPPFSFYMAIENTYPIAEMRFMLFFIELRFMLFFIELFYNPKLIFYFTSFLGLHLYKERIQQGWYNLHLPVYHPVYQESS